MASNSSSSQSTNDSTSYTAMSIGDVEAIGTQCQMEYCRQLDFLPFRCESCRGQFCLDHRTERAHKCSKEGAWARARAAQNRISGPQTTTTSKPNILTHEQQCSHPQCKTLVDTPLTPGVHCQTCNRRYCLKHRMKEDHACSTLKPLGARPISLSNQKERGLAALEKIKSWGISKKASLSTSSSILPTRKSSAATSLAAINSLKTAAKGDTKVPPEKRVYLHVEASADTTKAKFPTGKFFYSQEWSVGRVLDAAAKALQVENVNNRGGAEAEKLRVFHVEGGRLLEFSEKLGDVAKTGNTIVLLRGVGPAIPDLIDA
jgi:AN1-type zinc finger protein 1